MKNRFLWPLFAAVALFYFACDCPPMFPLEEENLQSPFRVETFIVDNIVILRFNKPIDSSSLIAGKTLMIDGGTTKHTGYYILSSNHLTLTIPQCEIYCNAPQQNCPFTFRLDGDNADGIALRSENGQILDGDDNGSDGGNFIREVTNGGMFDCGNYTLTVDTSNVSYIPIASSQQFQVRIDVTFSANIDISSVHVGENVYLKCAGNSSMKELGKVSWPERNKMRFIADKDAQTLFLLCVSGEFAFYEFIIKGTGPNPVKSVYGVPVQNGADYVFSF